jgi:ribosome-associated protein
MSALPLPVNDRVVLPASELRWTAVRASGPGGQNVNKVSSKVELRFDLMASVALDEATRRRLRALVGSRVTATGELVLTSQKTRDQAKNLEDVRQKLVELVLKALERPTPRRPTRPSRARVRARLDDKRRHSEKKASRQGSAD